MSYDFERELGIEASLEAKGNKPRREDQSKYTIELDPKRVRGCMLQRALPYVIRDHSGNIVQYAKTEFGAWEWVKKATVEDPDPEAKAEYQRHLTK